MNSYRDTERIGKFVLVIECPKKWLSLSSSFFHLYFIVYVVTSFIVVKKVKE